MEQEKELSSKEAIMDVKKESDDPYRLEKRMISDYNSIASSAISNADTSQLEYLINTIKKEDIPSDSVLDTVLFHASAMLNQIGYTNEIIQSRSKRKIKKQKNNLERRRISADNQINHYTSSLAKVENHLAQSFIELKENQEILSQKKKKLAIFEKEISDYKSVTKTSLDPTTQMYIQQAELNYQADVEAMSSIQNNCDDSFISIKEYYSRKTHDLSNKSLFEGEKMMLISLQKKLSLDLDRTEMNNYLSDSALNRSSIISTYKLQNELLDKENKQIALYNKAVDSSPSYKEMSSIIVDKRKSLAVVKR